MNLQVTDESGEIRFRADAGEPVCEQLLRVLGISGDGEAPRADIHLSPDDAATAWAALHAELLRGVGSVEQASDAHPYAVPRRVLGTSLRLDARNRAHAALMRLADLVGELERAVSDGAELCLYFVPALSVFQSAALASIRGAGAVSSGELRSAAAGELRRLAAVPGTPDDARTLYRDANRELNDEEDFERAIELFVRSGFLTRSDDGVRLLPTRKLRAVIL
jgi:hypothetical protein